MAVERLKSFASHITGTTPPPHPSDPLSEQEIETAVAIVRKDQPDLVRNGLSFNAVALWEPRKAEMMAWVADPAHNPRPKRCADIVAIGRGSKVYDGVVDLTEGKVITWEETPGVQPLISMQDLQIVEGVARKDPKVIEQCGLIGIPPEDMHKVYCDRKSSEEIHFGRTADEGASMDDWLRRALWQ